MSIQKKTSEKTQKLTVRVSKEEKDVIQLKADQEKKSLNQYLVDKALNAADSCQSAAFEQAQRLIRLQRMIDDIQDRVKKEELRKECVRVWQHFEF